MSITHDEILKIAQLSKLNFTEDELHTYCGDIEKIVAMVAKIQAVDTTGIQPLYQPVENAGTWRADKPEQDPDAIKQAKEQSEHFKQGYFCVPRVIS